MNDSGILRDGQVRAERQFLKDAAHTERLGARDVIASLLLAIDDDGTGIGP